MNNLNTVLIEGNLTRDPKPVVFAGDHEMCRFSIANNRYYMKKGVGWHTDTSFFIVEVFGAASKACVQHLRKGRGVRIVGRLKQNSWLEGGMPRELVTVIAEHIEFQPDRQKTAKEAAPAMPQVGQDMPQIAPSENQIEDVAPEDFECTTDISGQNEEPSNEESIEAASTGVEANELPSNELSSNESAGSVQSEESDAQDIEGGDPIF